MSEPFATTGKTEMRPCPRCDASVEHHEMRGLYGSVQWSCQPHHAPCGLPCFGGGARGHMDAYRARKMHGLWGYPERHWPATEYQEATTSPASPGTPCPACGAHGFIKEAPRV